VGTFNETVLVGRIGTGGENIVVEVLEKFSHSRIVIKFTALIKVHVLVLDRRSRGVTFKEGPNPSDRSTFAYSSFTVKATSEVVTSKDVAGLTIKACVAECAVFVL
jgi:hypothetical protein